MAHRHADRRLRVHRPQRALAEIPATYWSNMAVGWNYRVGCSCRSCRSISRRSRLIVRFSCWSSVRSANRPQPRGAPLNAIGACPFGHASRTSSPAMDNGPMGVRLRGTRGPETYGATSSQTDIRSVIGAPPASTSGFVWWSGPRPAP